MARYVVLLEPFVFYAKSGNRVGGLSDGSTVARGHPQRKFVEVLLPLIKELNNKQKI